MALVTNGLTIPPAGTVNSTSSSADARQLPVAGARSVVPLVYGTDRIAGLVLNVLPAGANSSTLLVQVLWCFACAGVSDVRLNGQALPAGSTVTHYLGSQSSADSALVAAFSAQGISYTTTLAGYAYSVVAMPTRAFDGELAITGLVQGRKLYDPRKDSTAGGSGIHRLDTPATWEQSDNPALALADFLSNATYGAGEAVVWSSVATLANANDALVGTSPPEKRRTLGLSLIKAAPVRDWAETLRAYAGAWLVPTGNGLKLVPDAAGSAVATYTHAAGQIEAIEPLQLRDLGDSPTVVEVIYTDTSAVPWRDASAVATLSGAGTTRPWRVSTVRLPGIQRYSQAMSEATERLNKLNLSTLTTRVTLFDEAAAHEQGDIVSLTHPCGLSASLFRVLASERLQSGSWALEVAQYSAAVYNDSVVTRTSFGDPSFVSPAGPPSTPTGLSVSVTAAGNVVRWDANPESDVLAYELRVGGTDWATATPLVGSTPTRVGGTSYVWAPPASAIYTLRLVAIDSDGLQSAAAVLSAFVVSVDVRNNLIDLDFWRKGGSIAWPTNGESNQLISVDTAGWPGFGGPKGGSDSVWYSVEATGDGGNGGGWNNAPFAVPLEPTKTYRFVVPIRRIGGTGSSYWGTRDVCDLNTTTANGNPYFAAMGNIPTDRWYLFVGYVYPYGSTGNSSDSAGVWDCKTGLKVQAGLNWNHGLSGASSHRAYQFYASANAEQVFGRPCVNVVDGTEPSLRDYFEPGAVLNDALVPSITAAASAAAAAASAAAAAQASANTANTALAAISSDSVLSRGEKPQVVQDWLAVAAERGGILAQANAYGITTERDAYTTAHDALNTYLSGLSPAYNDTSTDTAINGASFRLYWVQLYDTRQALLNRIVLGAQAAAIATAEADAATKSAAAQAAAEEYAEYQAYLANVEAKAYADGVVDAEEARAIADATAKANAARVAAETAAAADATAKANVAALTATWSGVSGAGKPADNATVGATFGVNINGQAQSVHIAEGAATSVYTTEVAGPVTVGSLSHTPDGFTWQDLMAGISMPSGPAPELGGVLVLVLVTVTAQYNITGGSSSEFLSAGIHSNVFDAFNSLDVGKAAAGVSESGTLSQSRRFTVTANAANTFSLYAKKFIGSGSAVSIKNISLRVEVIKR